MHPGPLLAYLMADPELSLQSMLMVAAVIGRSKTAAYVGLVALFSICAGLIYGTWIDGAALQAAAMALGLFAFVVMASYLWSRGRVVVRKGARANP
ncbi:MAG: permease, partial [Azovibrio sp.]|uniref:permease n=1 Tax=Azovibrio sp. TaxID=1872673 RepID=UPI003C70CC55